MKAKLFILTSLALFLATATPTVLADLITTVDPVVTQDLGGLYHYEYTLTNDAASDFAAIAFRVDVADTADLQSLTGPTGWSIFYAAGDPLIEWESSDSSFDLAPGGSLVFSFASLLGPITQTYGVLGFDGAQFLTNSGLTLGPGASAVPEPSSVLLMSLGALGMIGLGVRRRNRGRVAG